MLKERSTEDTILNETCTKTTTTTFEEEHFLEDEWETLESSCTNKDIPTANTSDIEFVNIDNSLNVNSAIRAILKKQKVIDFENIEAAVSSFIIQIIISVRSYPNKPKRVRLAIFI